MRAVVLQERLDIDVRLCVCLGHGGWVSLLGGDLQSPPGRWASPPWLAYHRDVIMML